MLKLLGFSICIFVLAYLPIGSAVNSKYKPDSDDQKAALKDTSHYATIFDPTDEEEMCGATIISRTLILTAASCNCLPLDIECIADEKTYPEVIDTTRVAVGKKCGCAIDEEKEGLAIKRVIVHPKFNPESNEYDVAVIELAKPLDLCATVQPIALPTAEPPPPGTICIASGCGLTEDDEFPTEVRAAHVPIISYQDCRKAYGQMAITKQMICAGEDGQGPSNGDEGGPLVCNNQLTGIVSHLETTDEFTAPAVYTNVFAVLPFITDVMKNKNPCGS